MKTRYSLFVMLAALLATPAHAQNAVLDEHFGDLAPGAPQCPPLPAGWLQFNADGHTVNSSQFTWPAGNPGWANWTMSDILVFAVPQYASNCAAMSSARFDTQGELADRWLVTPAITVPAGARLRFRTGGTDGYEVRWAGTNASPAAMLADADAAVMLSAPQDERGAELVARDVDLAALAGKTGHLAFRLRDTDGFFQAVDDVWVGVPAANEYPITALATPADGSGGDLVCHSGVAPGGTATCTAIAKPGHTFHHQQGIGGCNQPGDVLDTNNDRCTMGNVQGPRTLTATFVPHMPPPTDITATPDGAGNVVIGWTLPDTILPIWQYNVSLFPLPQGGTPLHAQCPDPAPFPGTEVITSCTLAGYQAGTAYAVNLYVSDGWGFRGHGAQLSERQVVQIATVDLPGGGQATLVTKGPAPAGQAGVANVCMLSGAPAVLTPDSAALAGAGAPSGSEAPLGALQLEATGCVGQTVEVSIGYPAGALAGLQPWAQRGAGWQAEGTIGGDAMHYRFAFGAPGDTGTPGMPAATGDFRVTLAPLAVPPAASAHAIGGSITGLTGTGLVLRNNGGDDLPVPAGATSFVFATRVAQGGGYAVTVQAQPGGQTCAVANGSGSDVSADVADVRVDCQATGPGSGPGVHPVPTLSAWAGALLSLLTGALGLRHAQRKRQAGPSSR